MSHVPGNKRRRYRARGGVREFAREMDFVVKGGGTGGSAAAEGQGVHRTLVLRWDDAAGVVRYAPVHRRIACGKVASLSSSSSSSSAQTGAEGGSGGDVVDPVYLARRPVTSAESEAGEAHALGVLYADPQHRLLELQQALATRAAADADEAMAHAAGARRAVTGNTGAALTGDAETDALAARVAMGITGRSASHAGASSDRNK